MGQIILTILLTVVGSVITYFVILTAINNSGLAGMHQLETIKSQNKRQIDEFTKQMDEIKTLLKEQNELLKIQNKNIDRNGDGDDQ